MTAAMLTLFLAAFAGAISAFAFEPAGLWLLMPIAFAVLLALLWRAEKLWRALLIGWLFGLGQFVIGLNWIATAFTFQAAMPPWLGWIAVVLLSFYLAVYPALGVGLAWRIGREHQVALVLALAGGWAVTEWLRAGMFTGFAWNPVGAVLVPTPLIGTSPLIGTYGLSLLTVLLGATVWLAWRRQWVAGAAILAAVGLLWLLPAAAIPDAPAAAPPIRIVQPNIGQDERWRAGFSQRAAQKLAMLSNGPGGERPRLLFWPESAITDPLEDERRGTPEAYAQFERARAAASVEGEEILLTGGIAILSENGRELTGATNSAYALGPGGVIVGRYDKAHLVPYGEYLPMRPLLSKLGLSRLAPGDADFAHGPGPRTLDLGSWGKVGLQICYEIIFSGEVVDKTDRPDFIFNPSNDAWFGRWGPPQHLAQARLRAAEEGLPVIRSTPTGISALVDARGRLIAQIGWRQAGIIDARLPPAAKPTPFARFGNIIPLLLSALLILTAIALVQVRRYRHI